MPHNSTSADWANLRNTLGVNAPAGPIDVVSPIDGELLAKLPEDNTTLSPDVAKSWAQTDSATRQRALSRFAAVLRAYQVAIASTLCLEAGLPLPQCERSISRCVAHLDGVSATLRLPPDAHNAARWCPKGSAAVALTAQHSVCDDIKAIASALYCGCAVAWAAPTGRQLMSHLLMHLWHTAQDADLTARAALVRTIAQPASTPRPLNRVWIAPSAPVEQAVAAIVDGLNWQNGTGVDSLHHVMVDHSLHWEIENRLTDALANQVLSDPRTPDCQRADAVASPKVQSIAESDGLTTPEDSWPDVILQPITDVPAPPESAEINGLSLFTCDQRDIDQICGPLGHTATRLCFNTVPSLSSEMSPLAWHPWLQPQQHTVELDTL